MKFQTEMIYVGTTVGTSKKTGNSYMLPKFMDKETQTIFEFYLPSDKLALVQAVSTLKQFVECAVTLEITSYNNTARVDLNGVEQ